MRHRLLPALIEREDDPELPARLARLADRARAAGAAIDRALSARLAASPAAGGIAVDREALRALPAGLLPHAFAWLHRRAGAPYPAGAAARAEILRQLARRLPGTGRAACDGGGGWRWEAAGELLILRPPGAARERTPDFTYTLQIPGELEIPEIAVRVRVVRRAVEPWMLQGSPHRAALALPLTEGDHVTIRNRRFSTCPMLSWVVKELKKHGWRYKTFHCSFCRGPSLLWKSEAGSPSELIERCRGFAFSLG